MNDINKTLGDALKRMMDKSFAEAIGVPSTAFDNPQPSTNSSLTLQMMINSLRALQPAPKRYNYVVRIDEVLQLWRDLRHKGFVLKRAKSNEGKRYYLLVYSMHRQLVTTIYVDMSKQVPSGQMYRIDADAMEAPLYKFNGEWR